MIAVLDSSALLSHHRGEPGAEDVQALFEDPAWEIAASVLSITEIGRRLDALGARPEEVERAIRSYSEILAWFPVDAAVAARAIEVARACPARLPLVDALIAATASVRGASLVHRDRHIEGIPPELLAQRRIAGR